MLWRTRAEAFFVCVHVASEAAPLQQLHTRSLLGIYMSAHTPIYCVYNTILHTFSVWRTEAFTGESALDAVAGESMRRGWFMR